MTSKVVFFITPLVISFLYFYPTFTSQAYADEQYLSVSGGLFEVFDDDRAAEVRIEYRSDVEYLNLVKPFLGTEVTSEGSIYGLVGLYNDWEFKPRWYLTPSFGGGLYAEGGGEDLGSALQFRTQLEITYELENQHRVSAGLSHISNAGLEDDNPGA